MKGGRIICIPYCRISKITTNISMHIVYDIFLVQTVASSFIEVWDTIPQSIVTEMAKIGFIKKWGEAWFCA
jgi:hypothetical protein